MSVWFKQLTIFQLEAPLADQPDALEAQLEPLRFQPCLPRLPLSVGWVSPMDQEDSPLLHVAESYWGSSQTATKTRKMNLTN